MPDQITAPDIDNWLFQCGASRNQGHQPLPLTPESLAVLTEIGNTLEAVIPTKSDEFDRRWEWVSTAPCGTEQAYVDARKDSFCDDYTEQDARENFRWEYPRPVKTYRMTYIRTTVRGEPCDARRRPGLSSGHGPPYGRIRDRRFVRGPDHEPL